jgi:hypothetical protein
MKTTFSNNRTSVTFTVNGFGNELIKQMNEINTISNKYNAQVNLFNNKPAFKSNVDGKLLAPQFGSSGGTITFHEHSCEHVKAAMELIELLESYGYVNEYFEEVIRTHKADGTPYKIAQTFIEKVK